jgi:alpha-beta hydrolase superfamily lysophospholipase
MEILNRSQRTIVIDEFKPQKPKAIMIIVHGASEYFKRYHNFAKYLETQNILAVGYDHLGHGINKDKNIKGIFFDNKNGALMLVNDLEDVVLYYYTHYPDIPIFIFGHSMGSVITREFSIKTRLLIDGIILSGSVHPDMRLIKSGLRFGKVVTKLRGKKKVSRMLNNLVFGKLDESISHNTDNIDNYKKDDYCGDDFTNQAIIDLVSITKDIIDVNKIKKMMNTRYFIISGKDDPFSKKTKQLEHFINILDINNFKYEYKFYDNAKHELINEDIKDVVYLDVMKFVNDVIDSNK